MTVTSEASASLVRSQLRPDIQALRAIAVMLVISYHVAPQLIPGGYVGVDVFFVISGYLMTSHLGRELLSTGKIRFRAFYLRRARRLLPMALLVLLVTLGAGLLFLPRTYWLALGIQIPASALYVENWALALNSVNYLASPDSQSTVQQYWSLSLEEQFYIVWPAALVLVALIARVAKWSLGRAIAVFVIVAGSVSMVYCVVATEWTPSVAYFVTPARIWEFCLGALVWLLASRLAQSRRLRALLALTGLALIVVATFAFSDQTKFPGAAALIPCIGTALVIFAELPRDSILTRTMSLRPVQWLGGVSYSAYLWHWPLLIILPFALNAALNPVIRITVVVATLALSALSKPLVENTFIRGRFSRTRPWTFVASVALVTVVIVSTSVVAAVGVANQLTRDSSAPTLTESQLAQLGANAPMPSDATPTTGELYPAPLVAANDFVSEDAQGTSCLQSHEFTRVTSCTFGSTQPDAKTIALVGDSHAAQWMPALDIAGRANNWSVTTYLRASCPFSTTYRLQAFEYDNACPKWVSAVEESLLELKPDVIVLSAYSMHAYATDNGIDGVASGMIEPLAALAQAGSEIVFIRDTPIPLAANQADIPACVDKYRESTEHCAFDGDKGLVFDPQQRAAETLAGAQFIDLSDVFCGDTLCAPVIGNVIVYKDGDHISATFSKTMAAKLASALRPILERGGS